MCKSVSEFYRWKFLKELSGVFNFHLQSEAQDLAIHEAPAY